MVSLRAQPTDEEMAAILAAYQVVNQRVVVIAEDEPVQSSAWRFSGRWWTRPIASRRVRPG
jgi:hypothetical protein